ncbi:hypothetical protein PR048_005971 [Dryococelus australis]|uniref:Uncharacterized protein n=1 Tax=Dryococelus australis TaxID=614101 RepID=A0ABQ9IAV0_9NEOP|nr:hypothetical protein PR048_005971 [Dryococelus australis]
MRVIITQKLLKICVFVRLVDRFKKSIKVPIRIFHNVDQRRWDSNLPELNMALNSAPNNSTSFSPSKVFLGRELSHPLLNVWGMPSESMETLSGNELKKV